MRTQRYTLHPVGAYTNAMFLVQRVHEASTSTTIMCVLCNSPKMASPWAASKPTVISDPDLNQSPRSIEPRSTYGARLANQAPLLVSERSPPGAASRMLYCTSTSVRLPFTTLSVLSSTTPLPNIHMADLVPPGPHPRGLQS
jgi:hypothetical protein